MQPYEAHIAYYIHFFGDYNLSGMEFIKVTDFYIRNLEVLNESSELNK